MKNPVLLAFFVLLLSILAFSLIISQPLPHPERPAPPERPGESCESGQVRECMSGSCGGVSVCVDGTWSGCRWETTCAPGERVPCLIGGCSYAVRECNSCGTGYTECFDP